ncbi:hypothetical protein CAPTEDRAFT_220016 [Capitella teleta]|uniref:GPI inositol-deacylase transmembrane domain-containing protein n=1 Tax=Capitella teleta TaxID=283909 RepID=R7UKR4_CAPTE|nr:hypothetical protein CAPTEDRAFT_220016 [Capitella teleta]|eukprot:ELU07104.1 hypothetical protein CAPTEDRAFT_220016 [Capitella teleta]
MAPTTSILLIVRGYKILTWPLALKSTKKIAYECLVWLPFVRFYAPLLPAFFVIQILMVLAWQLKSLDETGIAPSFGEAHVRWAQPWRVVPVAMLLKFLLTYPEEDNIAKKIGLPVDDTTVLTQMNTWYAALPVMLYLSSYSVMGLYGPLVETVIGIKSFVFGALFRCALRSPSLMRVLRLCRLSLFILGVYLSLKVCGTLGIIITYIIFAFETGASYVDGRSQKQESKAFNRFYVFNTLLLLLLATLVLNAAPFLVWIKDYSVSPSLDFDPSRAIGVTLCVFGFLVTRAKFPVEGNEWYSVCGTLCYLSCVSMVTYTLLSVYRITYFIQADLIILATVVTIVSMATPSVPVKVKKN